MPAQEAPLPERPGASARAVDSSGWIALLLALLVFLLRWRWLDVPFERDEGEYVYGGRLLLEGVPPYVGLYNMKFPGVYGVFALLQAAFGATPRGIHFGLACANATSVWLLFALGRRLVDARTGLVAAAGLLVAQLLPAVQGPSANAEHFLLPLALGGLVLLARKAPAAKHVFAAGLLLGLALLVKQHGLFLAAAGVLWVALEPGAPSRAKRVLVVAAGVAAPVGLVAAAYLAAGHFEAFWLWTVRYAAEYARPTLDLPYVAMRFERLVGGAALLLAFSAAGLVALFRDPAARSVRARVLVFALLSFLAVTPGLHFRPHYFVLLLPAAALLAGLGARLLPAPGGRNLAPFVAALLIVVPLVQHPRWFFAKSVEEVSRDLYPGNAFVESVELGAYLAERTQPGDTIAVLGSEPQLYVYSGRRAATGYIYTYALMEDQPFALEMQRAMAAEIEAAEPAWIVFVRHPLSWLTREESEKEIFHWFERYRRDYELAAQLLLEEGGSRLVDGADLAHVPQPPPVGMDLFRRRAGRAR